MAPTILEVLQNENPSLDSTFMRKGPNSSNSDWKLPDGWRQWTEFSFKNLVSMYDDVLHLKWEGATAPNPERGHDREIWDENTLGIFLARFMLPDVNKALGWSSRHLRWTAPAYLAPGSWTGYADWALVSRSHMVEDNGQMFYRSLLPGDTKLSTKWRPSMERSRNKPERIQWKLPVSQVQHYAMQAGSRYGFIITDAHLVILRVSPQVVSVSAGRATTRPHAQPGAVHQRIASDGTDTSSLLPAMSIGSPSEYTDNDNVASLEYSDPEYAVVPWTASGRGRMTVKLALFFVCLMAGRGEATTQFSYPPLDSWWYLSDGTFMHNTSGAVKRRLPRGAKLKDPSGVDEQGGSGPEDAGPSSTGFDHGSTQFHESQYEYSEAGPSQPGYRYDYGDPGGYQTRDSDEGGEDHGIELEEEEAEIRNVVEAEGQEEAVEREEGEEEEEEGGEGGGGVKGKDKAEDLPASPPGSKVKLSFNGKYLVFEHHGRRIKTKSHEWSVMNTSEGAVYVCGRDEATYWARKWPTSTAKGKSR